MASPSPHPSPIPRLSSLEVLALAFNLRLFSPVLPLRAPSSMVKPSTPRSLLLDPCDFFHPHPQACLKSLVTRLVVRRPRKVVRQTRHVRHFLLKIVRVFISLSIPDILH